MIGPRVAPERGAIGQGDGRGRLPYQAVSALGPPPGAQVWLASGRTDMRRGMDGLAMRAMLAQQVVSEDPFGGTLLAFHGKRGGLVKRLWYNGQGMCLFSKRLERVHFAWPVTGQVSLTPVQLSMLREGIDWRMPIRACRPEMAG